MEPNVPNAESPRRHMVDLSKDLSPAELDRLQLEAENSGKSLKAYVLALIFVPRDGAEPSRRRWREWQREEEGGDGER